MLLRALIMIVLLCVPALGQEGDGVPLPRLRPVADSADPPLPRQRPEPAAPRKDLPEEAPGDEEEAENRSSQRTYQTACPALLAGTIVGEIQSPVTDAVCGVRSPYRVTGLVVGGATVDLTAPATLNCQMATELVAWVGRVDAYMQSVFNQGVAAVKTGTSYMCRSRNHQQGADLSEHGFANALDVTGFVLDSGREISLPGDWDGDGPEAQAMRHAHDSACGHFTTVLGPQANALHHDHLHLDLGCHGQSCTYRLCE